MYSATKTARTGATTPDAGLTTNEQVRFDMADKILPTPEQLRELLEYNPDTGKLYWRERSESMFSGGNTGPGAVSRRWNKRYAGKEALIEVHPEGYRRGRIFNRVLYAHRVIWAMQADRWPREFIDHVNGDRSDNRISNLREATNAENIRNSLSKKDTVSGVKGVHFHKATGNWVAQITVNRKKIYLGIFSTPSEAHEAYRMASLKWHKEFSNFG